VTIPLRVMTANLWASKCDPDGLLRVLDEVAPDVLAVQELQHATAEVVATRFPHHALAPHHATLGTGIATMRPAAMSRLPMTYRSGWLARLEPEAWPGIVRPLEVIGVHLANPLNWPWWRTVVVRSRQLAALEAHLDAAPGARVVVGDFNASPVWPAYRRLRSRLDDAAAASGTAAPTWRFKARTPPLLRIDHALVNGVRPVRTRTVAVPGADHLALVVDVEA
jgi:endonuclease/exonuclease/phosphatase family metal-dependent hydrolase